jgi:hypothetical protein
MVQLLSLHWATNVSIFEVIASVPPWSPKDSECTQEWSYIPYSQPSLK